MSAYDDLDQEQFSQYLEEQEDGNPSHYGAYLNSSAYSSEMKKSSINIVEFLVIVITILFISYILFRLLT